MKVKFIVFLGVLVVGLTGYLLSKTNNNKLVSNSDADNKLQLVAEKNNSNTQQNDFHAHHNHFPENGTVRATNPEVTLDELDEVKLKYDEMWQQSFEAEQSLKKLGYVPEIVEQEVYLDIDINKFMGLKSDDQFPIDVPQLGKDFIAYVQDNLKGEDNINTLKAVIMTEEGNFDVLISYSGDSIIGEVSTPDGDYIIEGTEQYAWLASRQAMATNVRPDDEVREYLDSQQADSAQSDLSTGKHKDSKGQFAEL